MINNENFLENTIEKLQLTIPETTKVDRKLKAGTISQDCYGYQLINFKTCDLKKLLKTSINVFLETEKESPVDPCERPEYFYKKIDLAYISTTEFINNQSFKRDIMATLLKTLKSSDDIKEFKNNVGSFTPEYTIDLYLLEEEDVVKFVKWLLNK